MQAITADNRVKDLLSKIQNDDADLRTQAWLAAGEVGPAALQPLAKLAAEGSLEVRRAACRAMWRIVRTAAAPGAQGKKETEQQLAVLLGNDWSVALRREVLWMLSEIGDSQQVSAVAALLKHQELCEDARCALQRIPGDEAVAALKAGFATAPEEFKYALADSLRRRGQTIEGYPSQKMIPSRQTQVKPVG